MCLLSGGASELPSVRRPRAEDHTGVQSHPCGPGGGGHEVGVQGLLECFSREQKEQKKEEQWGKKGKLIGRGFK